MTSSYLLYINHPNDKAVGHIQECRHVKKNGGGERNTGL
jgi:hypothetical protein